jgi:hypothetical protein
MTTSGEQPSRVFARLLLRLHELDAAGQGDGLEADAVREEMEVPWHELSFEEQERFRGLSEDLALLLEGGPKEAEIQPERRAEWTEKAKHALTSFQEGEVDAGLRFLSSERPPHVPVQDVWFLQARAWERLGFPEVALVFARAAERFDPEASVHVLTLLQESGRSEDALRQADAILANPGTGPEGMLLASVAIGAAVRELPEAESRPTYERLVPLLRRALRDVQRRRPSQREIPSLDLSIRMALGMFQRQAGDVEGSARTLTEAIAAYPDDPGFRMLRGGTYYPTDSRRAIEDYLASIRLGTQSAIPYLVVAIEAFHQGDYAGCLRLCIRASEMHAANEVRAQLFELIAICQDLLGQPESVVIENFDRAAALDPTSDRIRANRASAQKRRREGAVPQWRVQHPHLSGPPFVNAPVTEEGILQRRQSQIASTALAGVS